MPRLSKAQQAVFDYMKKTGDKVMVWPTAGHFAFGEKWGHCATWLATPKATIATIRSMKAKGCFVEVDRTNAAVRYALNPDFKAE